MSELGVEELHKVISDLGERYPMLSDDNLFVQFFLTAYLTGDEESAFKGVTGVTNNKGIDAVVIDHESSSVFIVQAKLREKISSKSEPRADVMSFAQLSQVILSGDMGGFKEFVGSADPIVAKLLKSARKYVCDKGYRLRLIYATLGNFSPTVKNDAGNISRFKEYNVDISFFDGRDILFLLRDYLVNIIPQIPVLDLEMESGKAISVNGVLQRYDANNNIESWVISMRGDKIAELFEKTGVRLFARNIRGFLGNTPVNEAMMNTLSSKHPEMFFYYNNGITVICDEAEKISKKSRDLLRVVHPQVINGQQTTRALANNDAGSEHASVLVKVIQVPSNLVGDGDEYDSLISNIVSGTNWQNTIKASDLMTNDGRQIDLERAFRKLGYNYVRRRQSKQESKLLMLGRYFFSIKKEKLAQAVAGCELDPVVPRSGMDNLFKEDMYTIVFPNSDPEYYLSRFWMLRLVTKHAKGKPERGYAKWLALKFLWSNISPIIKSRKKQRAFRNACEHKDDVVTKYCGNAIEKTFVAVLRYYRANRGRGDNAIDVSTFFRNKRGRDKKFLEYWSSAQNKSKPGFDVAIVKLRLALEKYEV